MNFLLSPSPPPPIVFSHQIVKSFEEYHAWWLFFSFFFHSINDRRKDMVDRVTKWNFLSSFLPFFFPREIILSSFLHVRVNSTRIFLLDVFAREIVKYLREATVLPVPRAELAAKDQISWVTLNVRSWIFRWTTAVSRLNVVVHRKNPVVCRPTHAAIK